MTTKKKSFFRSALPAVLLTAAAGCAPAWAGPTNVPFNARLATHETLSFDPNVCTAYPFLVGTTTGTGTASNMGAVTLMATDCITPNPPSFAFSNGKLTITAANGDELRASYSGTFLPLPNSIPFTLYTISGTFTVTGGTGRFSNATGSGYLNGSENIVTRQGQLDATGTISY